MYLEDSDGKTITDPTEGEILSTLRRIGSELDHCILNYQDSAGSEFFIQVAGSGAGLFIQYNELGGQYQSVRSDLDPGTVCRIFLAAAKGESGWKSEFAFEPLEGFGGSSGGGGDGRGRNAGSGFGIPGAESRSLKDEVLGSITGEAKSGFLGLIRRLVRLLFGKGF
jgi:hypothetical protein